MIEPLVLLGRLVTFDDASTVVEDGALYIGADERIAAVKRRSDAAPSDFGTARRVETKGVIYPGLMDLHNHCVTMSCRCGPRRGARSRTARATSGRASTATRASSRIPPTRWAHSPARRT